MIAKKFNTYMKLKKKKVNNKEHLKKDKKNLPKSKRKGKSSTKSNHVECFNCGWWE